MGSFPRISFGMIVLNGEPFVCYNLRALYPFAHEIIVVEGAAPGAAQIATEDGHSRDGTLETLYRFKAAEDPEDKLRIVTRDGFWTEKDEMSQAYAQAATGDYLWQVDVDEFYKPEDMQAIINMLQDDPAISAVSFRMLTFWGAPDYITDGWYLRRGASIYHRLFKWGEGYTYKTHRPPTVLTGEGVDTRQIKWITGEQLEAEGILMYHYSLLLPKQVIEKTDYYSRAEWARVKQARDWAQQVYMRLEKPFRVHNVYQYPSWLMRYKGAHPPELLSMWHDLQAGKVDVALRQVGDIEKLLNSPVYRMERPIVALLDYAGRFLLYIRHLWRKLKRSLVRIRDGARKLFAKGGV